MIAQSVLRRVVGFCQVLRANGFRVGLSETIDCLEALKHVDVFDKEQFRQALACTLVKRADQLKLFQYLFENYFSGGPKMETPFTQNQESAAREQEPSQNPTYRTSSTGALKATYSPLSLEVERSLEPPPPTQRAKLKRNLRALERVSPSIGGRRLRRSPRGPLDIKATFRASLRTGETRFLKHCSRKEAKNRVVMLVDVSGSMDSETRRLLELVHAASNTNHGSAVFCFSTSIKRVDNLVRGKTMAEAAQTVGSQLKIWGSGTRIGECLRALLKDHGELLDKQTVLVIVSDGWDLGDTEMLRQALSELKARVAKIMWFNPLADTEGYRPVSSGMAAALPYLDTFSGLRPLYEPRGVAGLLKNSRASGGV